MKTCVNQPLTAWSLKSRAYTTNAYVVRASVSLGADVILTNRYQQVAGVKKDLPLYYPPLNDDH